MRKFFALLLLIAAPALGQIIISGGVTVSGGVTISSSNLQSVIVNTVTLPPCVQGSSYVAPNLSASGGTAPYLWTLASGSLPPSVTFNSAGVWSGTCPTSGVYSFVVTATDSTTPTPLSGNSILLVISVTCTPLTITSTSPLPGGTKSSPYSYQFLANGGILPLTWSNPSGAMPASCSVPSTGLISCTPSSSGTFTPNIQVVDSCSTPQTSGPTAFSLTIANNTGTLTLTNTTPLPALTAGQVATIPLTETGGTGGFTYTAPGGWLPPGLSIVGATITGTPTVPGTYTGTLTVTDSIPNSNSGASPYSLTINPAPPVGIISNSLCGTATGGMDATANLPTTYLCSAEANTPRSGSVVAVGAGSLQTAYNNAPCGADIQLTAGLNYTITSLAPKGCSDSQWVWIRTAPSGNLPPEGTTTTPCYSNVTSLADYPAFPCPTSGAFTAKITVAPGTSITDSADHIRWENIQIAKGSGAVVGNLVNASNASKQVFDRVWFHGNPGEETTRAIFGDGAASISLVESVVTDVHCVSVSGACGDAQALSATTAPGPFKISHNFLSASGEVILFGGGGFASGTPSDIEISYNHGFKPLTWNPGCTLGAGCPNGILYNGGVGGHAYITKNQLEFKNAQRVLVFGNTWENNWGGFTQVGNAITLTPKSQSNGPGVNLCPLCVVQDITERYDFVTYSSQPWQIANVGNDNGAYATAGQRYSFHDDLADHVRYPGCGSACSVYLTEVFTGTSAPSSMLMTGLTMNHLTIVLDTFNGTDLMALGGPTGTKQGTGTLENSILPAGQFGIGNVGGATCAQGQAASQPMWSNCWVTPVFRNNGIPWGAGTSCGGHGCGGTWGASQVLAADQNAVQYTNQAIGNYQLQNTSPFHNAASDGTDIGAAIPTLNSYLAFVPQL